MSGYIVNQPQPHSAYAVSKASVHHLARSMAAEWVGHNIRVNSISPGIMNTRLSGGPSQAGLRRLWLEKSPMGIGNPEDLTGAVMLLCSDAGRFITGTDIKIDGLYSRLIDTRSAHTYVLIQAATQCSNPPLTGTIPIPLKHQSPLRNNEQFVSGLINQWVQLLAWDEAPVRRPRG